MNSDDGKARLGTSTSTFTWPLNVVEIVVAPTKLVFEVNGIPSAPGATGEGGGATIPVPDGTVVVEPWGCEVVVVGGPEGMVVGVVVPEFTVTLTVVTAAGLTTTLFTVGTLKMSQ